MEALAIRISPFWANKWREDGMTKPQLRWIGDRWWALSHKEGVGHINAFGTRPHEAYFNLWALPNGPLCPIPLDTPSCP